MWTLTSQKTNLRKTQGGYTLIGTMMAMIILTLVMSGAIVGYQIYMRSMIETEQGQGGLKLESALSRFAYMNGRLPCPADASLARTDTQYGRENCTVPLMQTDGVTPVPSTGGCNQPAGGLCNTDTGTTNARRGMVPFLTLDIPEEDAIDAYGMRIAYMVSMRQTDVTTYQKGGGTLSIRAVSAVSSASNPNKSLINPPDTGDFVVISSGANKVGAFPRESSTLTTTGDGRSRMTAVSVACTRSVTGSLSEFTNCDPDSSTVYAGKVGRRFVAYNASTPLPWQRSRFLDDEVAYFLYLDPSFWRKDVNNKEDLVLRDSTGLVSLNNTTDEKLDVSLFSATTGLPENAIRTSGALIADQSLCDNNSTPNCFKPSNLTGNPDTGTGGMKCPSGTYMVGVLGTGTDATPKCEKLSGDFCPTGQRLKGFKSDGTPLCVVPGNTDCASEQVYLCNDNSTDQISRSVNYQSNINGQRAWNSSSLIGLPVNQTLPAAVSGTVLNYNVRTVELKDNSGLSCSYLASAINPSTGSPYITSSHSYLGEPTCRYGFVGAGINKTETYTCQSGTWVRTGVSGDCTLGCTLSSYGPQTVQCNTLNWTHNAVPTKVKLFGWSGFVPNSSDWRASTNTNTLWSGTINVPGGTSCGGILPPLPTTDTGNVCNCTGSQNKEQIVSCDQGFVVDPSALPAWATVNATQFKQRSTFSCDAGNKSGTWDDPTPKKADVCVCDATQTQDVAYACKGGNVPSSSPTPNWVQSHICPSNTWQTTGTKGTCTCVPKVHVPNPSQNYSINCKSNDPVSGWTAMQNSFGTVNVSAYTDQPCDQPIAALGITGMETNFYPGGNVLGTATTSYQHDGGVNCHVSNSNWVAASAPTFVQTSGGTMVGDACWGAPEVAQWGGTLENPRPCYQISPSGGFFKYETCSCQ